MKRAAALLVSVVALGCGRGAPSEKPPIHYWDHMDVQPKFKAQTPNPFFADGRSMRPLVPGVVAVGQLREDEAMYEGKRDGAFVPRMPVTVNARLVSRGEERFNIYCSPCHDRTGSGQGLVIKRGYSLPVNLASEHTRGLPDGEIFDIITHGVRNMPAYNTQIPPEDRWAIVSWVRVLQRSQHASPQDVPANTPIDSEIAQP